MHGRPRKSRSSDDARLAARASELSDLQSQLLQNHRDKRYDRDALKACSKLLEINPEMYTAWNYRKLAVESFLHSVTDKDAVKAIFDEELRLVETSLSRNHKSYGAWHHRRWILDKGFSSADAEIRLLNQFLKLDSRNFHGWNYRRFVAALNNISAMEELKFTTDMININFSNYSAWHNRSVILTHLLQEKVEGFVHREKVLTEEFDLIHQAIFTDPDDQSSWFYHRWLVDQTITQDVRLISSWPIDGTVLNLAATTDMGYSLFPECQGLDPGKLSCTEGLPLVLYFSQPVVGVSFDTVIVSCAFGRNENLTWRPISANNSGTAHSWKSYLKLPSVKALSSQVYIVEVKIGHGQGIISANGSTYKSSSQFEFTLKLGPIKLGHNDEKSDTEMLVLNDENFSAVAFPHHPGFDLPFDKCKIGEDQSVSSWCIETLENEMTLFRELLSVVNCKIGKLTLARLLMAHDKMVAQCIHKRIHQKELLAIFDELMKLDPLHIRHYMDVHSTCLMEVVTSGEDSLLKHCWYYEESDSSCSLKCVCLRLNKLSLTRISSIEHLLWVQMLDLSYNELSSVEGLEAMQLLFYLNLSHNKIRSFTALEPLRLISSLTILDVSHNEIGLHSVDTTKYLCPSMLSYYGVKWSHADYAANDANAVRETVSILEGLNLRQLNVDGNAICDVNFKKIVAKVIPGLKWLNGLCISMEAGLNDHLCSSNY